MAAVNTANNLIYLVVSALLGFMGISGLFGKSNLSKIEVQIEHPPELYAQTPVPVGITIRNTRKFLPLFLLRVNIHDEELFFPFIEAGGTITQYRVLRFDRRGRQTMGAIILSSGFPFNFFIRSKWHNNGAECVVFPRLQKCELSSVYRDKRQSRGDLVTGKTGYESEILSIREYVHGDPIKYINWKATAKTGALKTKELSSLTHRPVVIDFDNVDVEDIEEKISSVAYTVVSLIRQNIPIGMKLNGTLHAPAATSAQKAMLLTKLALYESDEP